MAHIIGDIAVMSRTSKRTQILSCMGKTKNQFCKKDIYDADIIQQRINKAAEVRKQLEKENTERNNNLAKINCIV